MKKKRQTHETTKITMTKDEGRISQEEVRVPKAQILVSPALDKAGVSITIQGFPSRGTSNANMLSGRGDFARGKRRRKTLEGDFLTVGLKQLQIRI